MAPHLQEAAHANAQGETCTAQNSQAFLDKGNLLNILLKNLFIIIGRGRKDQNKVESSVTGTLGKFCSLLSKVIQCVVCFELKRSSLMKLIWKGPLMQISDPSEFRFLMLN